MDAEQQTRLCTSCATWRPVGEFRLRRSGSDRRHHQCSDCAAGYMRRWRAARRLRAVGHALTHLRRYRVGSPSQIENLAEIIVAAFHGPLGFVASYREVLDAARAAGDHRGAQRLLLGVLDFAFAADMAAARRTAAENKRQQRPIAERRRRRSRDDDDIDPILRAEIEADAVARVQALQEAYEAGMARRSKMA